MVGMTVGDGKLLHDVYSNLKVSKVPMSMPSETAQTLQPLAFDGLSFDLHMSCNLTF